MFSPSISLTNILKLLQCYAVNYLDYEKNMQMKYTWLDFQEKSIYRVWIIYWRKLQSQSIKNMISFEVICSFLTSFNPSGSIEYWWKSGSKEKFNISKWAHRFATEKSEKVFERKVSYIFKVSIKSCKYQDPKV